LWGIIPRKCLRYLTRNPFCRRVCCDIDPDEVSQHPLERDPQGPILTSDFFLRLRHCRRAAEVLVGLLGMRPTSEAWPMSARVATARQPEHWSR
jgi:hypothetical protein